MDLPWEDERSAKFATNVGLITSDGPNGKNVMACEWTHHISYSPALIAVCIGHSKATLENIRATKRFGVSLASSEQAIAASVAGGSSGKNTDKIAALRELGFDFYYGKNGILLVKGAAMNAECILRREIELGDHAMLVGEAIGASLTEKKPLVYYERKYWELEKTMEKPTEEKRSEIRRIVERHRKA